MADTTPYSTATALITSMPTWVNTYDAQRLAAYKLYDDMYHNNPGAFQLMLRGSDDLPVYMPTAKSMINTLARYVGRGFDFAVNPDVGTPNAVTQATQTLTEWFKREAVKSKFQMLKKEYMRFGDGFWYLHADPLKPEGRRISIKTIDPGLMFPITDDLDVDKVVGWDMVEQIQVGDETKMQISRWLKNTAGNEKAKHPFFGNPEAPVYFQKLQMDVEGWETEPKNVVVLEDSYLADGIIHPPIYHWKNNEETGNPFGSSELRSLERVIAGINQAVSDEDLALALAGLGVYSTNAGGPVGDDGQPTSWFIGPGEVIEDENFKRINGVQSITPSQDHIKYLESSIDSAVGITDVTRGQVSADVAESGVALSIRMAPTVDAADEKDLHIKSVFDQLLHDLKSWFKAYEGIDFTEAEVTTVFGSKLPTNRAADMKELSELLAAGVISAEFYRTELQTKFGYTFPPNMAQQIANEKAAANPDPYAERLDDPDADPNADPDFGGADPDAEE